MSLLAVTFGSPGVATVISCLLYRPYLHCIFIYISACGCSTAGSRSEICDADSGRCECQPNYQGLKCNRCAPGYYGFPACTACNCNAEGTKAGSSGCDSQTGECACKPIYTGRQCDRCLSGFYGFPDCKQCNCNPAGTKTRPGGRFGDCSTSNVVSKNNI